MRRASSRNQVHTLTSRTVVTVQSFYLNTHQAHPPVVEVEKRVDDVPLVAVDDAAVPLASGGSVQSELVPVELGNWPSEIAASVI